MNNKQKNKLFNPKGRSSKLDCNFILIVLFIVGINLQPFFLVGKINLFELGIYLPGIQSVFEGKIPYRDFFYLRGPMEIYFPALFMRVFGNNVFNLSLYFYLSAVAAIILFVFLAKHIFKTRYFLWLLTLILIARTFPRVVFTFWGGMRFVLGAVFLIFLSRYLIRGKKRDVFTAGIVSALALLTSIDVGISCVFSLFLILLIFEFFYKKSVKGFLDYSICSWSGFLLTLIIAFTYLYSNSALSSYFDSTWSVISNLQNTFNSALENDTPNTILEFIRALIPGSDHFKYITPVYLYLIFSVYFIRKWRRDSLKLESFCCLGIVFYGIVLYALSFRIVEGSQFEMALQPEKIILFFLLEEVFVYLLGVKHKLVSSVNNKGIGRISFNLLGTKKIVLINIFFLVVFMSSICYSIARFSHRFPAWQLVQYRLQNKDIARLNPLNDQPAGKADVLKLEGLILPIDQAEDFSLVKKYIEANTNAADKVMCFDELGIYNYIIDRPFVGRFPMVTFTWLNEEWHEEFLSSLKKDPPKMVLLDKNLPNWFEDIYFRNQNNRRKYDEVLNFVDLNYRLAYQTNGILILRQE